MSAASELAADEDLARQLRVTWGPFFGRHGRLRPIQRVAMPAILKGTDVLVIAPTATGKTEAACAPLVERNFTKPRWTILYVSPTRALVNDLYERLAGPIEQLGLTTRRRTGDHRDQLDEPPNLLLTTPESFDSLLCRGRRPAGEHVLGYVEAVVLDEVHLIYGTARGEQVRWLLHRLDKVRMQMEAAGKLRSHSVQIVALSATVPDATDVAAAYLPPGSLTATAGGARQIEVVAPAVDRPDAESAIPGFLAHRGEPQKLLVFSNSRKRVDHLTREIARALEPDGFKVLAHHGSLSMEERESAERALKREARIVVCATMTLEIGIDIGDVDVVVLDSPAPSVPSLLQRIGRGNRRTQVTRLMVCSGSLVESLIHAAMLEAARAGDLGSPERGPQYAVSRQQIASYIFQAPRRSRPRSQVTQLIGALMPDLDADGLLDHLVEATEFEEDEGGVRLGASWRDLAVRGSIHSNIEDAGGYQVVDERTGAAIGTGIRSQQGRGIGVAGKLLEVRGWDQFKILVRKAATEVHAEGEWSYTSRGWMHGAGQPQAVRRYLGIPVDNWPLLRADGERCVFHFGGARRRAVLELVTELTGGLDVLDIDDWAIWLREDGTTQSTTPPWLGRWTPAQLSVLLSPDRLARMERVLARPVANQRLPLSVRIREVSGWLRLEVEHRAFSDVRWTEVSDPNVADALGLIARSLRRER